MWGKTQLLACQMLVQVNIQWHNGSEQPNKIQCQILFGAGCGGSPSENLLLLLRLLLQLLHGLL